MPAPVGCDKIRKPMEDIRLKRCLKQLQQELRRLGGGAQGVTSFRQEYYEATINYLFRVSACGTWPS